MRSTIRLEGIALAPGLVVAGLVAAGLVAALLGACDRDRPASPPPAEPTAPASSAAARPALSALPDGLWSQAMAGDQLAVQRLALDRDVDELLEVARSDAEPWAVALEALAFADDAEHVFEELASLAASDAVRRGQALTALRAIATRRPEPVEPRDPPGVIAGAQILDRLSRDASVARGHRALAISALRGLARSGRWDPSRIAPLSTPVDAAP